jgi:hypothetical protein
MKKPAPKTSGFSQFWQKYWFWIVVVVIVLIAAALRFYQLGVVPHGLTWDEAAIGYNGLAIWKARRDEWLVRLPVSFKSFGDYKAPLAIYLSAVVSGVLGLSVWSLRLPFAFAGVLSVLGVMLWLKVWLGSYFPPKDVNLLALLAGGLLSISSWHLHFSRAGFESGLALTWIIWGMVFFSSALHLFNKFKSLGLRVFLQSLLMIASGVCFVASLYTYHSAKVFVPMLAVLLLVKYWRQLWNQRVAVTITGIISTGLTYPLLKDTFAASGGTRFAQASIFSHGESILQTLKTLLAHFAVHFSPGFLWLGDTTTLRHGDGHWGVLYLPSILIITGGVVLLALRKLIDSELRQLWLFALGWVVIGILPAAIGAEVPHANRALLALPGFILLTVFGLRMITSWLDTLKLNKKVEGTHGEDHLLRKSLIGTFLVMEVFCFAAYTRSYYTVFAKESTADWTDGYIDAMKVAASKEKEVDKILFTSQYQQPYIFALFVRKTDPIWYQGGSLVKYEFTDKISAGDLSRNNTLVIADPAQIDPKLGQQLIYGADGSIRFVIVQTPHANKE